RAPTGVRGQPLDTLEDPGSPALSRILRFALAPAVAMVRHMGEPVGWERRAVVAEIMQALGDGASVESNAWWQYVFVVAELGDDVARQLVQEVHAVEARGGMTTRDGSRRRTPGGVFFVLAYDRLGEKRTKQVRLRATRRFQEEMLRRL